MECSALDLFSLKLVVKLPLSGKRIPKENNSLGRGGGRRASYNSGKYFYFVVVRHSHVLWANVELHYPGVGFGKHSFLSSLGYRNSYFFRDTVLYHYLLP